MDVDRLPAGPELDWLVLHHALDWKEAFPTPGGPRYTRPGEGGDRLSEPTLWPVSADAALSHRLVAHVEAAGAGFALTHAPGSGTWDARIWRDGIGEAATGAETMALAVSRALLKAVIANLIVKGYRAP